MSSKPHTRCAGLFAPAVPARTALARTALAMAAFAAMLALTITPAANASTPPTKQVNTTGLKVTDTEVYVGQLHSATGTMAISETGSIQAEQLAIDQINAAGGILGRKIKVVQEDGASDWPTFAEKAKKLLVQDKVAAVFGCWTSASRKAVLPVFEKENGLLYYPTFYEGLEQSKNVFYTGQEATQQIIAGLDWIAKTKGAKSFYLVGSDYIWPRTSNKIARKHIENVLKGTVVGEEYYPLGHTQFGSLINKIKLKKPDVIYSIVVGGWNVAWWKQLKAAGLTADKQTILTISVTEDEVLGIGGENMVGLYSADEVLREHGQSDNNKTFVAAFKAKYGKDAVIGDVTQAAYVGPWLWKMAVEKAGSFDVDKVVAASPNLELNSAPEGYVKVHPNHHLWSKLAHRSVGRRRPGEGALRVRPDRAEPVPEGLSVIRPRHSRASRHRMDGVGVERVRLDPADAGVQRSERVQRAGADGARARDHLRADGRHQHGARRVPDHRRVHDVRALAADDEFFSRRRSRTTSSSPSLMAFFVLGGLAGYLVELALIRHLYKRPLDSLLATWGLSLIMQQLFRSTFGAKEVSATLPEWLLGSWQPTDTIDIPLNGLFVMALTILLSFGVWLFMYRSRAGLRMRATTQNRTIAGAVGINTARVDRMTFALGCGIAGVAGAAFTTIGSTGPTSGSLYIVDAFLTVVFGGAQSLLGTLASAFSIAQTNSTLEFFINGSSAKVITLLTIIVILMIRPQGLFCGEGA